MFTLGRRGLSALILAAVAAGLSAASPAAADTGDPLAYHGGPVDHAVSGVLVDWGSNVNSIYTDETSGDPGLIKHLAADSGSTGGLDGLMAQYLDTTSTRAGQTVGYGGQFVISPSVSSTTIQDSQIQTELVTQIQAGRLPAPEGSGVSTIYLMLFPAGDTICMPDGAGGSACSGGVFCAYHGSASLPDGRHVLYAVLPDNTAGPMRDGCGTATTALQNQTAYTSHEWTEAITDPLAADAATAGPPLAWYDDICRSSTSCVNGEIGDKCNGLMGSDGGWTVQQEWSNLDARCAVGEPGFAPPTARYSVLGDTTAGQTASFSASGSADAPQDQTSSTYAGRTYSVPAGVSSYAWNWGDGTPGGSGAAPTHIFATPGTYQVSLTVTDNLGFRSIVTSSVLVGGASSTMSSTSSSSTSDGTPTTSISSASTTTTGSVTTTSPPVTTTSSSPTAAPAALPPAPGALTGTSRALDGSHVRLSGVAAPRGQRGTAHFELGTSRNLGHSSATVVLAAGGTRAVTAVVGGLRPRTRYLYRLVVSTAGGTAVGAERTVSTPRTPPAPRLAVRVQRGSAPRVRLRHSLIIGFSCSSACVAHFELVDIVPALGHFTPVPLALGRGTARLEHRGSGLAFVRPLPALAAALRRHQGRLMLLGYASGPGGATGRVVNVPVG